MFKKNVVILLTVLFGLVGCGQQTKVETKSNTTKAVPANAENKNKNQDTEVVSSKDLIGTWVDKPVSTEAVAIISLNNEDISMNITNDSQNFRNNVFKVSEIKGQKIYTILINNINGKDKSIKTVFELSKDKNTLKWDGGGKSFTYTRAKNPFEGEYYASPKVKPIDLIGNWINKNTKSYFTITNKGEGEIHLVSDSNELIYKVTKIFGNHLIAVVTNFSGQNLNSEVVLTLSEDKSELNAQSKIGDFVSEQGDK